jgi:Ribonuclease G/E
MSTELIINASLPETRIALLEDGEIQELLIERASGKGIVGNIYKGRVTRVLPGMQAAFVDIGLEKAAFLYVDDVFVHSEIWEQEEEAGPANPMSEVSDSESAAAGGVAVAAVAGPEAPAEGQAASPESSGGTSTGDMDEAAEHLDDMAAEGQESEEDGEEDEGARRTERAQHGEHAPAAGEHRRQRQEHRRHDHGLGRKRHRWRDTPPSSL